MGIAAWRWVRRSRRVRRRRIRAGAPPEVERMPRRDGPRVQDARHGVGPVYQRRYTVRISGSPLTPEELIDRLGDDLNAASPVEVAVFDKTAGAAGAVEVGDEYLVHMPGPWNCPVRVVERTPASFRFATLRGHMEAGEIEFRAADGPEGLVFMIESWARSGDRFANVLYSGLGIAKEMQLHMWTHFCERVAELSGGRMVGEVEASTERADMPGTGPVTGAVAAAAAQGFALAARWRGGRPLHPRGLVVDFTMVLRGTSRSWFVPLLDDRKELRGEARLSRAAGLPPVLPDILGLALRWPQPGGDAELLLATTGHTPLGRHLLRPTTRWSPGFYGSLLAYRAGDHRVLLGAVARRPRTVPADLAALARALEEGPLSLDLVVATEFGRWERFGELRLTGPARTDEQAPMRFDPARRPIRGLRPAGPLQQVRAPVYAAARCAARPAEPERRLHADLRHRSPNFDPREHGPARPGRAGRGWHVDDLRQRLPAEPPGPPVPGGSWEIARRLVRDYAYADPAIIRRVQGAGPPEPGRDMLLEGRFYGLRFHLAVRVGDVVDRVVEVDGRRAQVWGWNYRTLQGHLERGQMDQEVRKWLDTGEVEFRIHAVSRRGPIPNLVVRIGFLLFGRYTQLKFYRRACDRMVRMTASGLAERRRALVREAG
ncbi:DUF1990 family protein [Actinomadura algeriensis]|uniref:Uncharacterized protein (UPF0548 family) n=1 Tax=Actinomadura algeriensis TaxID=1679523 RepID=A0ABR9JRT5_9ACTN|nr:DUF1990 family protein [Actinomadura algeriensis]MBE1532845.1 uncharacterized protein (UPF0548 family) [Actinomadura algeriensis]